MIKLAEIKIVRIHIEMTLADRETDHVLVSDQVVHCEIWISGIRAS